MSFVQKDMLVITGIHPSAPFIEKKKRSCELGNQCAFKNNSDYLALRNVHEKKSHTVGIIPRSGKSGGSPNALSCEQLVRCAEFFEPNMQICWQEILALVHNLNKVQGTFVQECEKFSYHRAAQLKRLLSHLGQIVTMKIGSSLWTAANPST